MPFTTIGLSDRLVQGILATGFVAPTEIQSQAIPLALGGHDIIACAQTGTGKTAAFVLPILHRMTEEPASQDKKHHPYALILTPTRELAVQIESAIRDYGRFLKIRTLAIYGGVSMENQLKALRYGVDIAVCTPGRLLDHIQRKTIDLTRIHTLVVDEADRMFDMGFIKDVRKIIGFLPTQRQTLLFSATISADIKGLAASILKHPKTIQIGKPRNPIETITQHVYPVQQQQKMGLLLHLLETQQMDCVLVFSRTKHGADRIRWRLDKAGIETIAIHSDRSQQQRLKALEGFRRGKYRVMVATDIAARGIDVEGISHVINYDVPGFAEDYIHRIGRTGRATATGDAITFVAHEEHNHLRQIEKFIGRKFEHKICDDFVYDYPVAPVKAAEGEPSVRTSRFGKIGKFGTPGGRSGAGSRPRRSGPGQPAADGNTVVAAAPSRQFKSAGRFAKGARPARPARPGGFGSRRPKSRRPG